MSIGLKELIKLWVTQKRRDFSWRTFFVGVFLTIYFAGIIVGVYIGVRDQLDSSKFPFEIVGTIPIIVCSTMIADLLMKLFWRRSPVEMDDYLRTRPMPHKAWSRFILLDTICGGMQWMVPVCMAFVAALFMPLWTAPLVLVLGVSSSVVNALFQNCWRRAPGNQWTLPLVPGYMVWTVLSWVVAIACFMVVEVATSDSTSSAQASKVVLYVLVFSALFLFINVLTSWALMWYFSRLRNHNEEEHAPVHVSAKSLGEVSEWSIEWVQLMRSKRLRVSVLTIAIVFLLNTYMQQMPDVNSGFKGVNLMLLFGIAFPSIIIAQWVFGVEANYFAGIWTKPWSVEGILRRKFMFLCGMCVVMALLILPCVAFMNMSFWMWLSTLLFGCGVFVLPFMATCLFSSRMDLFASAFFNYQGGNKQINIFSFVMFVPMGIYFGTYFLIPQPWSHLIIGGLGLLCLLLHRKYIHWIAKLWFNRRYAIMERWQTE